MTKENNNKGSVRDFFAGKNVFITGASGLMGKVLIWKLLHSCPQVDTVYILVRPKWGVAVEARVEEMFKVQIFNAFKKENPQMLRKVVAVAGDVAADNLGLSAESKKMLEDRVNVVFHVAATLKLDANLKDAVLMNTEGTLKLLKFAENMTNLQAFVHTSTAYCHCDVPIMEERVYNPPDDPYNVINLVKWMDRKLLADVTERIISPHPNTYTYSKRLAEKLVSDYHCKLPVAIARPSIVTPSWKEPMPGWVDNLNGPVGIMVGAAKGVIRSMLCNAEYNAEVIPCDVAINGLLSIAWKTGTVDKKPEEIPVYNLTQGDLNPTTWGNIVEKGKEMAFKYPFEMTLWYPGGDIRKSVFVHTMCTILFHWIPAYFIDFMMLILGQKRFMLRVQKKIHDGLRVLQYFTTHQWRFRNTKFMALRKSMTEEDNEIFNMAMEKIDPDPYMIDCILGARHYCMKEDPSTIPKCRRNIKILWVLDRMVAMLFYAGVMWLVVKIAENLLNTSAW